MAKMKTRKQAWKELGIDRMLRGAPSKTRIAKKAKVSRKFS